MFGGLCFMVGGAMCCGLTKTSSPEDSVALVSEADLASESTVEPVVLLSIDAPVSVALTDDHLHVASSPGEINEKQGSIVRVPRSKLPKK